MQSLNERPQAPIEFFNLTYEKEVIFSTKHDNSTHYAIEQNNNHVMLDEELLVRLLQSTSDMHIRFERNEKKLQELENLVISLKRKYEKQMKTLSNDFLALQKTLLPKSQVDKSHSTPHGDVLYKELNELKKMVDTQEKFFSNSRHQKISTQAKAVVDQNQLPCSKEEDKSSNSLDKGRLFDDVHSSLISANFSNISSTDDNQQPSSKQFYEQVSLKEKEQSEYNHLKSSKEEGHQIVDSCDNGVKVLSARDIELPLPPVPTNCTPTDVQVDRQSSSKSLYKKFSVRKKEIIDRNQRICSEEENDSLDHVEGEDESLATNGVEALPPVPPKFFETDDYHVTDRSLPESLPLSDVTVHEKISSNAVISTSNDSSLPSEACSKAESSKTKAPNELGNQKESSHFKEMPCENKSLSNNDHALSRDKISRAHSNQKHPSIRKKRSATLAASSSGDGFYVSNSFYQLEDMSHRAFADDLYYQQNSSAVDGKSSNFFSKIKNRFTDKKRRGNSRIVRPEGQIKVALETGDVVLTDQNLRNGSSGRHPFADDLQSQKNRSNFRMRLDSTGDDSNSRRSTDASDISPCDRPLPSTRFAADKRTETSHSTSKCLPDKLATTEEKNELSKSKTASHGKHAPMIDNELYQPMSKENEYSVCDGDEIVFKKRPGLIIENNNKPIDKR